MTPRTKLFSKLLFCLGLSAGTLAVTTAASAQTQMQATVPFAFTADNITFPAGHYTVTRQMQSQYLVYITNVDTGDSRIVLVRPDSGESNAGPTRLTFHRQAGGVYLSQIWSKGSGTHSVLTSHPKPSKEMAKSSPEIATFEIATK